MLLDGAEITRHSPQAVYRAGVTRTFQRSRLSLPLTVFDNVAIGQTQHMNPGLVFNLLQRRALRRQVDETVEQVHALLVIFILLFRPDGLLPRTVRDYFPGRAPKDAA